MSESLTEQPMRRSHRKQGFPPIYPLIGEGIKRETMEQPGETGPHEKGVIIAETQGYYSSPQNPPIIYYTGPLVVQ